MFEEGAAASIMLQRVRRRCPVLDDGAHAFVGDENSRVARDLRAVAVRQADRTPHAANIRENRNTLSEAHPALSGTPASTSSPCASVLAVVRAPARLS